LKKDGEVRRFCSRLDSFSFFVCKNEPTTEI
jgi:hypothetical protein